MKTGSLQDITGEFVKSEKHKMIFFPNRMQQI
jgi:hypothetical protein